MSQRPETEPVSPMTGMGESAEDVFRGEAEVPAGAPAERAATPRAAGLRCTYRPIWDVRHGALLAYNCKLLLGNGERPAGASGLASARGESLKVDQALMGETVRTLRHLAQTGRRLLLCCCVHYETLLRSGSRTAYAALCRQIPKQCRNYVIFELVGVPRDLSRIHLGDAIAGLREHSRAIRCRVDLDWSGFDQYRGIGIDAFGIDLAEEELPEEALFGQLDAFCERVDEAGFTSFAHGVHTTSLATSCVVAGVAQIDGDAVHTRVDTIEHVYRYQSADLFAHLIKAKG
jgi:hypothetical protein